MAERCFPNNMPDFVNETEETVEGDPLQKLLALPYASLQQKLLKRASELKEKIVKETWHPAGRRVKDFTLYTGLLGTAFLLFKSYQVTDNKPDLIECANIIHACEVASRSSYQVTFLCGRSGVCALGAVVAKHIGDQHLQDKYLGLFNQIQMPHDVPNELLYGRSGYLWACSFLNKNIGYDVVPINKINALAMKVIEDGKWLGNRGGCPLMYEWHEKKYWGAAHGLAGIMHVLMDLDLNSEELVKCTLLYMTRNHLPSGNYPSSEGSSRDQLVHWCHGAPGVTLTLAKAAEHFKNDVFMKAASKGGDVVWSRGLLKHVGLCHGVSGNAYVFLSLYRLTHKVEYLYRAKAFTCFLLEDAETLISTEKMHGGERPLSMFEGLAGMAHLFLDMVEPLKAKFPAYEI